MSIIIRYGRPYCFKSFKIGYSIIFLISDSKVSVGGNEYYNITMNALDVDNATRVGIIVWGFSLPGWLLYLSVYIFL